jgi:hypothetical protein
VLGDASADDTWADDAMGMLWCVLDSAANETAMNDETAVRSGVCSMEWSRATTSPSPA